jgi:multimeric flavodoxin WrbA
MEDIVKVVAFNGSPQKNSNTAIMINEVIDVLKNEGIETEILQFAGHKVSGCINCRQCFKMQNRRCAINDDVINDCIELMDNADGIIIASPTYFANVTTEIKALIDRAGFVGLANGGMFRRKIGVAIAVMRRMGAIHVFNSINHFFFINEMIVPGSNYWNCGIGLKPGDCSEDSEGLNTMKVLGTNMAWLMKKGAQ